MQKVGGISRLNFELIKALSKKNDVEQIFYHGLHRDNYPFEKEWFSKYYGVKLPDFLRGRIFNLLDNIGSEYFYNINARDNVIYHSLYYRVPKNHQGLVVVHVYDMMQELFGDNEKTIRFKKKSFDRADLIISISQSTKRDLCKLYSINPDKIIVAYPGVSEIFFRNNSSIQKLIKRPYMLYVGARNYKYKNFDFLLNTFISKKYFLDFDLMLVGGEKGITLEQEEKIKNTLRHGSWQAGPGKWLLQEFGDDQTLANLYASASAFIYPSLYEGFGIPLLEAMAAGCPVIASNTSSIPEVVGNAGLLFNPENPDDLVQKIEKIINDKTLAKNLIDKGKIRARQFTWENMADKVYGVYVRLLKNKNLW